MTDSRNKYLLKNTTIFAIGNFATKLISFFLIPLYTNALTTSEYGTVDLVTTISTIAVPILTLNIGEAVMRFNLDRDVDRDGITKIGMSVLLMGMLAGSVLIPLSNLFVPASGLAPLIYFYVLFSATSQVFLCDLRGKEMLVQYSIGNVLNTLLIVAFNILFLLVFKLGIKGYLLAYTMAFAIVTIYALVVGKGYRAIKTAFDSEKARAMLRYSIMLIPNSFMWWIMNSSDHIMVTSMVGVAANGIYAISYKLPTLITTITQIFTQAWSYSAIREEGAADEAEYNNRVFRVMIAVVMITGICMMAVIKPFLKIYVSPEYYSAWQYTPFLTVGCAFLTLASFMSTSYTVHKDSLGFLFSGLMGALLNVVLNFLLIPVIQTYGAALATCVSYIVVFVFRLFHTRKYLRYEVMTKEFIVGVALLLVTGCLMFVDSIVAQIAQGILAAIAIVSFRNAWLPIVRAFRWKRQGKET